MQMRGWERDLYFLSPSTMDSFSLGAPNQFHAADVSSRSRSTRHGSEAALVASRRPLYDNMTSSTKPEVHNVL